MQSHEDDCMYVVVTVQRALGHVTHVPGALLHSRLPNKYKLSAKSGPEKTVDLRPFLIPSGVKSHVA